MHIIVCLDQKNGMLFHGRRQSKDRFVRAHMLQTVGTAPLWMNSYSAKQFEELCNVICVSDQCLDAAQKSEFCFVEDQDILPWKSSVEDIIVYRWNRIYPASTYFPEELFAVRKLSHTQTFPGYSHDEMIQEVYTL